MVFGIFKKAKDAIVSVSKAAGGGLKSAYNAITSTAKTVYTSVKNKCKKIAHKVKKTWDNTPLWAKVAIGSVVGAALGIGAALAAPVALAAKAAEATIAVAHVAGGIIGYLLHSEKRTDDDQPNRRTNQNQEKNRQEGRNSNTNNDQPNRRTNQNQEENRQEGRNSNTNNNIINVPQLVDIVTLDNDLNTAISLSLSEHQNSEDIVDIVTLDDDLNTAISLSLSEHHNSEVELQTALTESLEIYNSNLDYQEALAISLLTKMAEQEHEENLNIEIATQESIISFLEKFEVETALNVTLQTLIESANVEISQTLEGLDDEHRAMQLVIEALEELKEGKVHQHADKISQALRHFKNAGDRLDTAASLKRLDIILGTAKTIIEALLEIEAYDEIVEFCTKLKVHLPEFVDLFDNIENQLQNGQWIENFDDIVNRNERTENNIVHLIASP
jgi:hypothetical protein